MTESEIWFQDPYAAFARGRPAAGPVFVPAVGAWVVARPDEVLEVLRRADEFSSANTLPRDEMLPETVRAELADSIGGRPVVVNSDGAAHRRYRAPLLAGLTPARVGQVVPFIEQRAAELVDGFAGDGRVEFVGRYASVLAGETIGRLIGLEPEQVAQAVYGTTQALVMYFFPVGEEHKAQAARKFAEMRAMIDAHVRRRYDEPRDDLTSALLAGLVPAGANGGAGEGGSGRALTLDERHEVASNGLNLFSAGFITATPLLGTMVLNLLRHREQWELLCAKPELIPAAVEEATRYDTSMQSVRRITTADVPLAGVEIPAGATLLVALASANRDAEVHDRPDTFDITRPIGTAAATRHLSFGHGPHACVGAQLFREEAQATLRVLTERLPNLRLAPQEEGTMGRSVVPRDGSLQELNLVW